MTNEDWIELFFSESYEKQINEQILEDIDYEIPYDRLMNYVQTLLNIPLNDFLQFIYDENLCSETISNSLPKTNVIRNITDIIDFLASYNNCGKETNNIRKWTCEEFQDYQRILISELETAQLLGISFEYYNSWYLSALGYIYPQLHHEQQESILIRLVLRVPFFRNLLSIENWIDEKPALMNLNCSIRQSEVLYTWFKLCRKEAVIVGANLHIKDFSFSIDNYTGTWNLSNVSFAWEKVYVKTTEDIVHDEVEDYLADLTSNDEWRNVPLTIYSDITELESFDAYNLLGRIEDSTDIFFKEICVEDYIYGKVRGSFHEHVEYADGEYFSSLEDVLKESKFIFNYSENDDLCPACKGNDVIALADGTSYCCECHYVWSYRYISVGYPNKSNHKKISFISSNPYCNEIEENAISPVDDTDLNNNIESSDSSFSNKDLKSNNKTDYKQHRDIKRPPKKKKSKHIKRYYGYTIKNRTGHARLIDKHGEIVFEGNGVIKAKNYQFRLYNIGDYEFTIFTLYATSTTKWKTQEAFVKALSNTDLYKDLKEYSLIYIADNIKISRNFLLFKRNKYTLSGHII